MYICTYVWHGCIQCLHRNSTQKGDTYLARSRYDPNDPEVIEHLKLIFSDFDKDGDGIEWPEVLKILQKVDTAATEDQAQQITAMADKDGSGVIDFTEFLSAVTDPALKSDNLNLAAVPRPAI